MKIITLLCLCIILLCLAPTPSLGKVKKRRKKRVTSSDRKIAASYSKKGFQAYSLQNYDAALKYFRKSLRFAPDDGRNVMNTLQLLRVTGQGEAAKDFAQQALDNEALKMHHQEIYAIFPQYLKDEKIAEIATWLEQREDVRKAGKADETFLSFDPVELVWRYALSRKFKTSDPNRAWVEMKRHNDLVSANSPEMLRSVQNGDNIVKHLHEVFFEQALETLGLSADSNFDKYYDPSNEEHRAVPVFIAGPPRSGTTLLEKLISRSPRVYGIGEPGWAAKIVNTLSQNGGLSAIDRVSFEKQMSFYFESQTHALNQMYDLPFNSDKRHLVTVDKSISNHFAAGIILLMFPRAKIIFLQRGLLDTAVSNWMTRYTSQESKGEGADYGEAYGYSNFHHKWSYTIEGIVQHLTQGVRITQYWEDLAAKVPYFQNRVMTVKYEELVTNPKKTVKNLTDFLQIEYSDDLLKIELENNSKKTFSNTASLEQVKESLNTRAIGKWKAYRDNLQPLIQGFEEEHMKYGIEFHSEYPGLDSLQGSDHNNHDEL